MTVHSCSIVCTEVCDSLCIAVIRSTQKQSTDNTGTFISFTPKKKVTMMKWIY